MVVDGIEGPVVGKIDEASIRWSNDCKHLAYVAEGSSATGPFGEGREWVILDGKAQARYSLISDMEFSADGKHLAYIAHGAGCAAVLDGHPGTMFDEIEWRPLWAHRSLFTPDGRHMFYQARRGGTRAVVLDSQPGPEYDSVLCIGFRLENGSLTDDPQSLWPPHILPGGVIQYPALTVGNPAELHIVTQLPIGGPATPHR